jgi:hypothetical protein
LSFVSVDLCRLDNDDDRHLVVRYDRARGENQLMRQYAANATKTSDWVWWIVDDALPDPFKVVGLVAPLL